MLTDKLLNLFTYAKCALQVTYFTSNLVASEGCVWEKWAKGWNICKRIAAVTLLLETHLNNRCPQTSLLSATYICLGSWWWVKSSLTEIRLQAGRARKDRLCLTLSKALNPWPMGFPHVCSPPEPTDGWFKSFITSSMFSSWSFYRFLCKTNAVWTISRWPSVSLSCCGWTQSSSILMGITCNVARKSKVFSGSHFSWKAIWHMTPLVSEV